MGSLDTKIPQKTAVLVVGGGPAGSSAAAMLRREGLDVTLLESAKFPRYHVGESMLPSFRNHLRFIGLEEEFSKHGFVNKPGANFKLVPTIPETFTDFANLGPDFGTWNVIRSEMDEIMLRHAQKEGVNVFEETKVTAIEFLGDPKSSRPISVTWSRKDGSSGNIAFDWLVDASGKAGLMSTKYLENRQMRESLRNVAVWGYWKDVNRHGAGTKQDGSAWFEALSDETGWAWSIPLHDGTTSIGFVMHSNFSNAKKAMKKDDGTTPSLTEHYMAQIQFVPGVKNLIGEKGNFIPGSIKSASDYSYSAARYSGDHFRIIGDAANFIDPFFSSGVHLSMTGALSASVTICASMKGQADEVITQAWHDAKIGIAHTRFLFVVLGAYKQMHLQSVPVLSDVNEETFDKAFEMFRPVIFGLADSQKKLTDSKVSDLLEVCQHYFDPTVNDEDIASAKNRYGVASLSIQSPILGHAKIKEMVQGDSSGERVLKKFEAMKVFRDDVEMTHMERDPLLGFRAHVKRGELGLTKVEVEAEETPILIAAP